MNFFEKFISTINVKGVLTLSVIAVSCWIVMLGALEWIDRFVVGDTLTNSVRAIVVHPINFNYLQIWLNFAWALHIPLFTLNKRPRIVTRLIAGFLTAHWVLFASVIAYSTWYDISLKLIVWIFTALVVLSNFRVEMGDDV